MTSPAEERLGWLLNRIQVLNARATADNARPEDRYILLGWDDWNLLREHHWPGKSVSPSEVSIEKCRVMVNGRQTGCALEVQPGYVQPPRRTYT